MHPIFKFDVNECENAAINQSDQMDNNAGICVLDWIANLRRQNNIFGGKFAE